MAFPSNLQRTKDWGSEVLTDTDLEAQLDLIINWVMDFANSTTGHDHSGTSNKGPKLTASSFDLTGDFAFTGKTTFDAVHLAEQASAPSTSANEAAFYTKDVSGTNEIFIRKESDGAEIQVTDQGSLSAGTIVQVVNDQTGAYASGTTQVPLDDTIPQNTEGNEFMTLAITPTNSSNKLKIDVVFFGGVTTSDDLIVSLFQDSTADALANGIFTPFNANEELFVNFTHYMDAGTTSATTFKVRAGASGSATTYFNGNNSGRRFGGVTASSITITEIKV